MRAAIPFAAADCKAFVSIGKGFAHFLDMHRELITFLKSLPIDERRRVMVDLLRFMAEVYDEERAGSERSAQASYLSKSQTLCPQCPLLNRG